MFLFIYSLDGCFFKERLRVLGMDEIDQRVTSLEESVDGIRSEMTKVKSDLKTMKTSISRILQILEPRESSGNIIQTSSIVLPPVDKPPEDSVTKQLQPSAEVNKNKEGASSSSGIEDERRLETEENGNPSVNDLENGDSRVDPLFIIIEDKGTDPMSPNEHSRSDPLIDSNKDSGTNSGNQQGEEDSRNNIHDEPPGNEEGNEDLRNNIHDEPPGTDPVNEEGNEDSTNNIQDEPPKKRYKKTLTVKNILGTSIMYNTKNNKPSIQFRMDVKENSLKPIIVNFQRIEKATVIYKTGLEEFKENVPKVASILEKTITFFNSLPN